MTHIGYIAAAYGFVAFVILSLVLWIFWDRRAQLRRLAKIDARRVPRSDEPAEQRDAAPSPS